MNSTLQQEIILEEGKLTKASTVIDLEALDRLYADDIMMTNVLGHGCLKSAIMDEARRGIAERQAAAAAGTPIETSYTKEDLQVVGQGDTAITSYRFVVKLKAAALNLDRTYRTTNVWMRRDGRWRVVAAHTALVLTPAQVAKLVGEPA